MAIKVVVGSTPTRTVATTLETETKPLITPDSVTLGIDTIGNYVANLEAGNGIILLPEDANTRNVETSNIVVMHANTSTEISTNNDVLEIIRNVDIDVFGHITQFENTSFNANNFFANSTVISSHDITLGTTSLTLGEAVDSIQDLTEITVGDFTVSNNIIQTDTNIILSPNVAGNNYIYVSGARIANVAEPLFPQDAVTKNYIDTALDQLEDGLLFVADPQGPNDATNKRYVDNLVQGLNVKPGAKAATTGDIGGSFSAGNTTFGATITLSPRSTLNVDGVVLWDEGDNILVKDQNNSWQNGSYDIVTKGNAGTPWVLQRSEYTNSSQEVPGSFEFVTDGTQNGKTGWVATVQDAERFVIDQDHITYSQFSGEGTYTAGKDLTLAGREFRLNNTINVSDITALTNNINLVSDTVVVTSSGGLVIPVGSTGDRPTPQQGMIRYNTTDARFEAYNGSAWTGLGGVVDVDQDTFIRAESNPGADNDSLEFFTAGEKRLEINQYGRLTFGNSNAIRMDYASGNTIIDGKVTIADDIIFGDGQVAYFNIDGAIKLPQGSTGKRPSSPETGMIRFNTFDNRFEGYDGTQWAGLAGSVIDIDQDTKIIAESGPGDDNDQLEFFTSGQKRLTIEDNGDITSPSNRDIKIKPNRNLYLQPATGFITATANVINLTADIIQTDNTIITGLADPVNQTDAVNLRYLEDGFSSSLIINDGANSYSFALLDNPTFNVGRGLEILQADEVDNEFRLGLDATGVSPGIYGKAGFVPNIRVLEDGRLDFATELPLELQANVVLDFAETTRDTMGLAFRDARAAGLHQGVEVIHDDSNNYFTVTLIANTVADVTANAGIEIIFSPQTNAVLDIGHANTSDVANTATGNGEIVTSLEFDQFGHVTSQTTTTLFDTLTGGVIAPRFIDSANSEYFIDPQGTSQVRNLILGYGFSASSIEMKDGPLSADRSFIYATGGQIGFLDNSFNYFAVANRNTGDFTVTGNLIAGGFADAQDPSYVINPADLSNMKRIEVEDTVWVGYNIIIDQNGIDANNGIIDVNSNIIRNLGSPVQNGDAVTLEYLTTFVDEAAGLAANGSVNVDGSTIEIVNDTLQLVNPRIYIAGETGNTDPVELGETLTFAAGEGINTLVSNNQIEIIGELANNTNIGMASFAIANFAVNAGEVALAEIDGGTF